jgi:hypothetical protein
MFEIKEIVSYTWGFLFFSITKQNEKSFVFSCRQPVHSLLADSSQFVTERKGVQDLVSSSNKKNQLFWKPTFNNITPLLFVRGNRNSVLNSLHCCYFTSIIVPIKRREFILHCWENGEYLHTHVHKNNTYTWLIFT